VDQYIGTLIGQYRSAGILVDTNLLLLYFVGYYDPQQLERWSRTKQFTPEDFAVLVTFLQEFDQVVSTPHVLTEVSNLLGQLQGYVRDRCFELFASDITRIRERHTPAETLSTSAAFTRFGITDAAISDASPGTYLVLTDDFPLYHYLSGKGVDVLNFNNIRPFYY
jgi:hypothetical protein